MAVTIPMAVQHTISIFQFVNPIQSFDKQRNCTDEKLTEKLAATGNIAIVLVYIAMRRIHSNV